MVTTSPPGVRVAAAAPAWVRRQLAGETREAPVVHAGADAVYVDTGGGCCVGLLTRAAAPVPCGLATALATVPVPPGPALVGEGRLVLVDHVVTPTRTRDHAVPPLGSGGLARLARSAPAAVSAELPATALSRLAAADPDAVSALLGRGSGLTPLGDDVLAGWLATAVAAGHPDTAVADAVQAPAPAATTTLSATLLRRAVAGDVLPQFRRLLLEADSAAPQPRPAPGDGFPSAASGRPSYRADDRPGGYDAAVADLVAVGHTSGAGLLLGASLAACYLTSGGTTP